MRLTKKINCFSLLKNDRDPPATLFTMVSCAHSAEREGSQQVRWSAKVRDRCLFTLGARGFFLRGFPAPLAPVAFKGSKIFPSAAREKKPLVPRVAGLLDLILKKKSLDKGFGSISLFFQPFTPSGSPQGGSSMN